MAKLKLGPIADDKPVKVNHDTLAPERHDISIPGDWLSRCDSDIDPA